MPRVIPLNKAEKTRLHSFDQEVQRSPEKEVAMTSHGEVLTLTHVFSIPYSLGP